MIRPKAAIDLLDQDPYWSGPPTENPYALDELQVARFREQGVVGPFPRFADDATLSQLHDYLTEVLTQRPTHPLYGDYPKGRYSVRDWHLVSKPLLDFMSHPAVVGRVRSLGGDSLTLWRSKIFHKPPGAGELGWHQEWGYFNGEEIGSDRPALIPAGGPAQDVWNWTVWFALSDISFELGPIRFLKGSNRKRYPWVNVPMAESAFFESFLNGLDDVASTVTAAKANNLFLDLDTSTLFDGVRTDALTLTEVKERVGSFLGAKKAKLTLPFDYAPTDVLTFDKMKRGEFIIFSERTMHGSWANTSSQSRLAINARITRSSTLVYPQRLMGGHVDGSNLDIRQHRCVLLCGQDLNGCNAY